VVTSDRPVRTFKRAIRRCPYILYLGAGCLLPVADVDADADADTADTADGGRCLHLPPCGEQQLWPLLASAVAVVDAGTSRPRLPFTSSPFLATTSADYCVMLCRVVPPNRLRAKQIQTSNDAELRLLGRQAAKMPYLA
jgi:hypothetical protein